MQFFLKILFCGFLFLTGCCTKQHKNMIRINELENENFVLRQEIIELKKHIKETLKIVDGVDEGKAAIFPTAIMRK